jgi:hypothetical protein
MKTRFLKIERNNVTIAEFYTYIRARCKAKGIEHGLPDRSEFENPSCPVNVRYVVTDGVKQYEYDYGNHKLGETNACQSEILRRMPLDYQVYNLNWDGSSFNVICEFTFDSETRGHGYFYQGFYPAETLPTSEAPHGEKEKEKEESTLNGAICGDEKEKACEGFEKGPEQELERAVGRWPYSAEQAAAWKRSESWLPGGFVGAGRAEVEERTRFQPTPESQKLSGDEKEECTMKCAICEDEIKGRGKKLADGNTVCKDCYESSAVIVICEDCGKEVFTTSAVKECGFLYCRDCHAKSIQEEHEWPSWVVWQEWCAADGETSNFEKWIARVKEDIAESGTRAWKKTALEVATREIEEARKVA